MIIARSFWFWLGLFRVAWCGSFHASLSTDVYGCRWFSLDFAVGVAVSLKGEQLVSIRLLSRFID